MENITKHTEYPCSGCGVCTAVCPKLAIRLEPDSAGFFTARVDENLCVNCGLCVKVCARFDAEIAGADLRASKLFALQSADPGTVKRCSSGGLAHELALAALREGGKAVGAVYDLKTNRVRHQVVDTEAGIIALDGSKYLQSNPQKAFTELLAEAKRDSTAHFTVLGTPCQIAGLAKASEALGIRDQLLLVEIFCHGVPSYKLWDAQLQRMKKKLRADHFDSLQFRYKKDDWHSYCLRAEANGRTFYGSRERELFWQVFFENILLGDACMTCRLRKEISLADLRIGDYWGRRYQSRGDGVSAAFACTERGKEALEDLLAAGRLTALEPGTPEEMLKAQNMEGYHEKALHDQSMDLLRGGADIRKAVRCYRAKEPPKRKLKRMLLFASSVLPDGLRARLRKANSSRQLQ
jgi:coenzyme F420-reducing hydrogenase beta subunit